jgi:hypothetical protein
MSLKYLDGLMLCQKEPAVNFLSWVIGLDQGEAFQGLQVIVRQPQIHN